MTEINFLFESMLKESFSILDEKNISRLEKR